MKYLSLLIVIFIFQQSEAQIDMTFGLNFNLPTRTSLAIQNVSEEQQQKQKTLPETKIVTSPELLKIPSIKIVELEKPHIYLKPDEEIKVTPQLQLGAVPEPNVKNPDVISPLSIVKINNEEYKLLQGLIFFESRKNLEVSISLFGEVIKNSDLKEQALFEYAKVAVSLGLYSEYKNRILQLIESVKNKALHEPIADDIIKNIQLFEVSDMQKIHTFVAESKSNYPGNPAYNLKLGRYYIAAGELSSAQESLQKITARSSNFSEATLLLSSVLYRRGELTKAISILESNKIFIDSGSKKDNLRNLTAVTLARLYFQKAQYNKSYSTYLQIDRTSTYWLQSVIEQAWAQILSGDNIGAAGNMFSLHTEIFRKVYIPESYVVRSVGYLNMCQFGDALHVLTDLDNRYKSIYDKITKYQAENKSDSAYYDLVRTWFLNTKATEIDSVPRSFVAELAVHSSFKEGQKKINSAEDESALYIKFMKDIQLKDQIIKKQIADLNIKTPSLRQQGLNKEVEITRVRIAALDLETQALSRGFDNLKKLFNTSTARLDNEISSYRQQAAKSIKERFTELSIGLGKLLEQEEVLAYEIYSGAGEHIRYQMAGGKIDDRAPASLTPDEKKSYKWKFRGEIWEDEIGHYRSSLKNVCPQSDVAQIKKGDQ